MDRSVHATVLEEKIRVEDMRAALVPPTTGGIAGRPVVGGVSHNGAVTGTRNFDRTGGAR